MREIILEVKAEAEAELLMAKAKIAVAESILAKVDEHCEKCAAPVEEVTEEALAEEVAEPVIEHFTDDVM